MVTRDDATSFSVDALLAGINMARQQQAQTAAPTTILQQQQQQQHRPLTNAELLLKLMTMTRQHQLQQVAANASNSLEFGGSNVFDGSNAGNVIPKQHSDNNPTQSQRVQQTPQRRHQESANVGATGTGTVTGTSASSSVCSSSGIDAGSSSPSVADKAAPQPTPQMKEEGESPLTSGAMSHNLNGGEPFKRFASNLLATIHRHQQEENLRRRLELAARVGVVDQLKVVQQLNALLRGSQQETQLPQQQQQQQPQQQQLASPNVQQNDARATLFAQKLVLDRLANMKPEQMGVNVKVDEPDTKNTLVCGKLQQNRSRPGGNKRRCDDTIANGRDSKTRAIDASVLHNADVKVVVDDSEKETISLDHPVPTAALTGGSGSRFSCDACSKTYATQGGLTKHAQFHCAATVAKSFGCKQCPKAYGSLGALKMHIRTHTLPCRCTLCGKAFSRPWLLQGHIRTHTGEKPFNCGHCGRAFADRSNLRAHCQTHSNVKRYGCETCGKTFSRLALLTKHSKASCGCASTKDSGVKDCSSGSSLDELDESEVAAAVDNNEAEEVVDRKEEEEVIGEGCDDISDESMETTSTPMDLSRKSSPVA